MIASGKMITPADVGWALCIGADFICTARGFMFALGCIQALQCNKDTCPTGITTHNPKLQKGLHVPNKVERVAAYVENLTKEVGTIAYACGVKSPRDLRRFHAHVIQPNGLTIALNDLYPEPVPGHLAAKYIRDTQPEGRDEPLTPRYESLQKSAAGDLASNTAVRG